MKNGKYYIRMGYMHSFKRVRRIKGKRKYLIQGRFIFDPKFVKLDYDKGFHWFIDGVPVVEVKE